MKRLLIVTHVTAAALLASSLATASAAEPVRDVRLMLPAQLGSVAENIGKVFVRQVQQRCEAKVMTGGGVPLTVELAIAPGIGAEGFRIEDRPSGVRILGNDERGLLYGVGKFLRTSRYDQSGFTPSIWRGQSVPACPVRGAYLATHFNNFYEAAPIEEVGRYVEDLALWGVNSLVVHFPHWQFNGFDDPAARKMLDRLQRIVEVGHAAGMRVGLIEAANDAFKSSPREVRNTPVPDPLRRHGNFGVQLCPAKPAAHEQLLRDWDRLLDEFAGVGLDTIIYWPYDEGGCGCQDCWPWGARGYPKLCRELSRSVRAKFPKAQIVLSTWTYDTPPCGEWEGLTNSLAEDKGWVDSIQADAHEDFPRYPLEQGVPGGLPLLNFPEISMWGQSPWGGYGANPLPGRCQRLWNQTDKKLAGGFPYSEGIYEDLNKVIVNQFYWNPARPASETVKEYLSFEYSPEVVKQLADVVETLERNHSRRNIGPSAVTAFEMVRQAEAKLTPQAKAAWRWRIFYLRALIDKELLERKGKLEGGTLKAAFEELTRIYHVEHAHSMPVKPPQVK
ncbi:MAG: hypothetical protein NTY19_20420 [Planctomycetota bacterium]|nr:hypothetical protein [Planctomycetota bacterium]